MRLAARLTSAIGLYSAIACGGVDQAAPATPGHSAQAGRGPAIEESPEPTEAQPWVVEKLTTRSNTRRLLALDAGSARPRVLVGEFLDDGKSYTLERVERFARGSWERWQTEPTEARLLAGALDPGGRNVVHLHEGRLSHGYFDRQGSSWWSQVSKAGGFSSDATLVSAGDRVHAIVDRKGRAHHAQRTGQRDWTVAPLQGGHRPPWSVALAGDVVVVASAGDGLLRLTRLTQGQEDYSEVVAPGAELEVTVALDHDDTAHLMYHDHINAALRYLVWSPQPVFEIVDWGAGAFGDGAKVAVDRRGRVHAIYRHRAEDGEVKMRYAHRDGEWRAGPLAPMHDVHEMFLALDRRAGVHLAYQTPGRRPLIVYAYNPAPWLLPGIEPRDGVDLARGPTTPWTLVAETVTATAERLDSILPSPTYETLALSHGKAVTLLDAYDGELLGRIADLEGGCDQLAVTTGARLLPNERPELYATVADADAFGEETIVDGGTVLAYLGVRPSERATEEEDWWENHRYALLNLHDPGAIQRLDVDVPGGHREMAVSPDGRYALWIEDADDGTTVAVWDVGARKIVRRLRHGAAVERLQMLGGSRVAVEWAAEELGEQIWVWNMDTGVTVYRPPSRTFPIGILPREPYGIGHEATGVVMFTLTTGSIIRRYPRPVDPKAPPVLADLWARSPDRAVGVGADTRGDAVLLDLTSGRPLATLALPETEDRYFPAGTHGAWRFTPDGRRVVTLWEGAVDVWSVPEGEHLRAIAAGALDDVDPKRVILGADAQSVLWPRLDFASARAELYRLPFATERADAGAVPLLSLLAEHPWLSASMTAAGGALMGRVSEPPEDGQCADPPGHLPLSEVCTGDETADTGCATAIAIDPKNERGAALYGDGHFELMTPAGRWENPDPWIPLRGRATAAALSERWLLIGDDAGGVLLIDPARHLYIGAISAAGPAVEHLALLGADAVAVARAGGGVEVWSITAATRLGQMDLHEPITAMRAAGRRTLWVGTASGALYRLEGTPEVDAGGLVTRIAE